MRRRSAASLILIAAVVGGAAIATQRFGFDTASPDLSIAGAAATTGRAAAGTDEVVGSTLFRDIVRAQNPVVVSITTESRISADEQSPFGGDEFFRRFFGVPMPREQRRQGLGSGFIISANGEILTNNHVVAGADRIRVGLYEDERTTYDARVLGRDPLTDSALIRLENPPKLSVATLGDSGALEPGDWVLAIGNPFRLGHTVTAGVVSYKARPFAVTEGRFQNMLQTDASINPGNSGGPLLNTRGEVVGINSAILSGEGGGGNIGIGFAVPINAVKALLPDLRKGQVQRGRLGVSVQTPPVTQDEARQLGLPRPSGAIVSTVERGSPADRAGLRAGDVIVEFNGMSIDDGEDLTALVVDTPGGTRAPVVFYRGGQRQTTTVTVETLSLEGERPREGQQAQPQRVGFGLSLTDITPEIARQLRLAPGASGAVVESVEPFAPAANAGVAPGDVILEINRQPVRSAQDAARLLRQLRAGQSAFVLLSRQGTQVFVTMRAE